MMWQVMGYAVGVAAALSLVGYCAERLAVMRSLPRRWVWPLTMMLSVVWACGAVLWATYEAKPRLELAVIPARGLDVMPVAETEVAAVTAGEAATEGAPTAAPRADSAYTNGDDTSPTDTLWPPLSDQALFATWAGASGLMLLGLCIASALLRKRRARWHHASVLGRDVLVSDSTGPALVGTWKPRIVVPEWFRTEMPQRQELILQHEEQHIAARDPLLLRAATLFAVALPWNLPLWWQLRRMRQAIELDCDARVLRRGTAPASYGAVLLSVARRTEALPGLVAMGAPASSLERRIRNLTPETARHSILRTTLALLASVGGIGAVAALEAPTLPEMRAVLPQEVPMSAPVLAAAAPVIAAAAINTPVADPAAQIAASRAAANLPRLLPPPPRTEPPAQSRNEKIELALVEHHPELVNGPPRAGSAFVSMLLRPDGSVESSEMQFVEFDDTVGMMAARVAARSAYLKPYRGMLLLAPGWHIAGGATVNTPVHVSYGSNSEIRRPQGEKSRPAPTLPEDVAQVLEHYLPGATNKNAAVELGNPYLVLSTDGRVLQSGYWSPAELFPSFGKVQALASGRRMNAFSFLIGARARSRVMLMWVEP